MSQSPPSHLERRRDDDRDRDSHRTNSQRSHRRPNDDIDDRPIRRPRRDDYSEERPRRISLRDDGKRRHRDDSRSPRRERYRDRSGDRHEHRRRDRSRSDRPRRKSPPAKRRRRSFSESRSPPPRRSRNALPSQEETLRIANGGDPIDAPVEKQKPNFAASGLLAKEANTVQGTTTVLKYNEPPEARKPPADEQWRMFIFKGKDLLDTVHLYARSCWLMGRDEKVTDLLIEHPSTSKQHAVIQFRYIQKKNEYGDHIGKVKPYLIDLESANGTRLNDKKIAQSRYVELRDGDVIVFGDSTREYVIMKPEDDTEK